MGQEASVCCQKPPDQPNCRHVLCRQVCASESGHNDVKRMQISALDAVREDQVNRWSSLPSDDPGLPACNHHRAGSCAEAGCSSRLQAPVEYVAESQENAQIVFLQRGQSKTAMWIEEFEEDQVETDVTDTRPLTTRLPTRLQHQ
eukprot:gb/GFBE01083213.1/.p1 GENE.gb/GFBE01083213.1/~~gb/GFBE01083213.1/.p1  ORF type:complete len:145 (+),score=18.24 gb/GFBE01083213.1/:1-435(+)